MPLGYGQYIIAIAIDTPSQGSLPLEICHSIQRKADRRLLASFLQEQSDNVNPANTAANHDEPSLCPNLINNSEIEISSS